MHPPTSALITYDRLVPLAGAAYIPWRTVGADLRTEAERLTGGQREMRIARARDCEERAQIQDRLAKARAGNDAAMAARCKAALAGDLAAMRACRDVVELEQLMGGAL